jgi:nucleoside-diphosphate-sugar epimerase
MPIQVAVLGAGGQVGPHLLEHLSEDPRMSVRGICRNAVTAGPLRIAGFDVRCGSVTDAETAEAMLGDCEVIVNCAAASNAPTLQSRDQDQGLIRSLAALSGAKRLIHLSSVGVYGTCLDARRNTYAQPKPDWSYGREKLRLEGFLKQQFGGSTHQAMILRMGHVYGAEQWVSRRVLDTHDDPERRLPFDGRHLSNAVHVRNVVAAIRSLILDWAKPAIYNLADSPASTWREVFDWNTRAIGAPPVLAMGIEESRQWSVHHRRNAASSLGARLAVEVAAWLRSQPAGFVSACPSARTVVIELLEGLRLEKLQRRGQMRMQRLKVGGSLAPHTQLTPEPWLFSDGAPGPQLAYRGERGESDARAVADWHRLASHSEAIWDWDSADTRADPTPVT